MIARTARSASRAASRTRSSRPVRSRTTRELVDVDPRRDPAPRTPARAASRRAARSRRSAWRSTASCRTSPTGSTSRCTSSAREGRVLVLAYHSLEDRMVKETFARWAGEDDGSARCSPKLPVEPPSQRRWRVLLTRRPLRPTRRRGRRQPAGRERPSARGRAASIELPMTASVMTRCPMTTRAAPAIARAASPARAARAAARRHLQRRGRPCAGRRRDCGSRCWASRGGSPRVACSCSSRSTCSRCSRAFALDRLERAAHDRGAAVRATCASRGRDALGAGIGRRGRAEARHGAGDVRRLHRCSAPPLPRTTMPDRTTSTLDDTHARRRRRALAPSRRPLPRARCASTGRPATAATRDRLVTRAACAAPPTRVRASTVRVAKPLRQARRVHDRSS